MSRVTHYSTSSPPLAGRTVALVHPAWHSCGTYRVVVGQIAAYRALGAQVFPVAVATDPGYPPDRAFMWRDYVAATPELSEGPRYFAGARFRDMLHPVFLRDVLWPYIHGDQAVVRLGLSQRAELPREMVGRRFDLVHCNHYFMMPVAERLARGAPILLDSHDLQARQFVRFNERGYWLKPLASYETMLAQELDAMRKATLLLHLNAEEDAEFRALLPEKAHALLYPATPPAPTGPGGPDVVLVASNNAANVDSVMWFLREAAPLAPGVSVKIAGNVDAGVKARDPELFARYRGWFLGRVEDPGAIYANAKLALLPTIGGTGLSIKSVEALSSGLPLIATPLAMRGMSAEALTLDGLTLTTDAQRFGAALLELAARPAPDESTRRASATRRYYEAHFSLESYERRLTELAAPLLA